MPQPSSSSSSRDSSDVEIATLYVTGAAYGVGTGIWLDAEAGISDPGLRFIAPAVLGVGAPIGVFFLDQPKLRRGVPAAISLGITLGGGAGFAIWSYQFTSTEKFADNDPEQLNQKAWGFKELARSTWIGSTAGGAVGAVVGFLQEPSPKLSLFVGSGALWGAGVGSMFGYGASPDNGLGYAGNNESAALGGLIGYGAGIAASAGLSAVWLPGYKQQAFMWMGAGAGFAVTLPVYLFYAGSDAPAKRGLIVQGTGTLLGIAAGGIFTMYDPDWIISENTNGRGKTQIAQVTGISPMPLPGGMGAQLTGILF
jgi:hypothetical protein